MYTLGMRVCDWMCVRARICELCMFFRRHVLPGIECGKSRIKRMLIIKPKNFYTQNVKFKLQTQTTCNGGGEDKV